jgi:hypothetical protein
MAKELFIFDVNPQSNFLTANAHHLFGDRVGDRSLYLLLVDGIPRI